MLSKENALAGYELIVDNDKHGTLNQKVLGLRLIFDKVLREMFPNISAQGFYVSRIDEIFNMKKDCGEFKSSYAKKQYEYHKLRIYFNRVMHMGLVVDEKGYSTAVRRLSSLIQFCSQVDIPDGVSSIIGDLNIKESKLVIDRGSIRLPEKLVDKEQKSIQAASTLCIIVDRRNDLSNANLHAIEAGIKNIAANAPKDNFNFVVFTIKKSSSVLAYPILEKKTRFSFNDSSNEEQVKPLRDYLINHKSQVQYHFFLSESPSNRKFAIPVSLNDSSFLMRVGIIDKDCETKQADSLDLSVFDKFVLNSKLPDFFDWIIKILSQD